MNSLQKIEMNKITNRKRLMVFINLAKAVHYVNKKRNKRRRYMKAELYIVLLL